MSEPGGLGGMLRQCWSFTTAGKFLAQPKTEQTKMDATKDRIERHNLEAANRALLAKREQNKALLDKQPIQAGQVEIHQEVSESEAAYWLAIKNNLPTGAPKEVIEAKRELWDGFDSDRHPALKTAVKTIVRWYNERIEAGGALVIAGGYGCGKTHLARAIAQLYGIYARVVYEPDLIGQIQDAYGGNGSSYKLLKQLQSYKLLAIDDLGSYHVKEGSERWIQGIYQQLLDGRYEAGKATLITTNLNDAEGELEERLGGRCYDRLVGAIESPEFYIDLFSVPSYRRRNF